MDVPITVLIVENDPASLMLLEYLVSVFSLKTVTASDARGARRLLAEVTPQIAIVDVILPDGDGIELLSEIRENNPAVIVALMTSTRDKSTLDRCAAWKPDAIFHNPVDADVIGAWLKQQLARLSSTNAN